MAIDVSYRDTYTTSAQDLSRFSKNFLVNEGVANGGLAVSQSGTPAMSVDVAVGTGYFYGSGSNSNVMYEFISDAVETVTIGVAGVQARIDIICLKVDPSTQVASIVAVAGTPSGSPVVPATPASHYKLAEVAVGISVTTITNANITDRRRSVFVVPTGARNQGLINGKIVPTVASNDLTVAIKTLTDTDPTATNPVGIWIGNELRWITSALSLTSTAGANRLNMGSAELATKEVDLFVYIGWRADNSTVCIAASRIPYARVIGDFEWSTSSDKGLVIGGFANVATDEVVNIGRFAATLTGVATHNWSVPTFTNANLIQEPVYESRELSWQPTYSGSGSMTYTSVTTTEALYRVLPNGLYRIQLFTQGTTGGTASNTLTATLPFQGGAGARQRFTMISQDDTLSGVASCSVSSNVLSVFNYPNGTGGTANFGLGTNRRIMGNATLEIR